MSGSSKLFSITNLSQKASFHFQNKKTSTFRFIVISCAFTDVCIVGDVYKIAVLLFLVLRCWTKLPQLCISTHCLVTGMPLSCLGSKVLLLKIFHFLG